MAKSVYVLAALGVAAAVAFVATMGNGPAAGSNFLSSEIPAHEHEFMRFVSKYRRTYGTKEEYNMRLQMFKINYENIMAKNAENGEATYGINKFSDYSEAEYKKMLGYKRLDTGRKPPHTKTVGPVSVPASVDWRDQGVLTPVKNQGQCGSCWAFSTTGSLESCHAIKTGELKSLSEQQLVDCSTWNNGCGGGNFDLAFSYTKSNPLESEANYPYMAYQGTCNSKASLELFGATGYQDVSQDDENALKAALVNGPVSVAIEADQSAFQSYTGGVIRSGCGDALDHAVLAVGYGSNYGGDYWIVKNSWGPDWGDNGYVKIGANNGEGVCGIQMQPSQVSC